MALTCATARWIEPAAIGQAGQLIGLVVYGDTFFHIPELHLTFHFRDDRVGVRVPGSDYLTAIDLITFVHGHGGTVGQLVAFTLTAQFVSHGHITVNGKRVNVPSYLVKDEDVIQVKPKSRELDLVLQGVESPEREAPDYLDIDYQNMKARFVRGPKLEDVPYPVQMEPNLVIEYYSR